MNYTIRQIMEQDVPFVWDMLYESLFVPEGAKPFDREILQDPRSPSMPRVGAGPEISALLP